MSVVVVTGSGGLIGSEAALFYGRAGYDVVGIDNDMRSYFFGNESSTVWNRERVQRLLGSRYHHYDLDIRDAEGVGKVFRQYGVNIVLIIHTAAQPSHDWAAREPVTDFTINANATLTLLETMRLYCSDASFIFTSTNKVYGDRPNMLPLMELETRWEVPSNHPYYKGIPEEMRVDSTMHSLFGVSKLAADVIVQEYGRYFGFKTVCFRGVLLTGAQHSGSQLHGFLSYLMKCAITETPYTVIGYEGKQVRDIIHAGDVIRAFDAFFHHPRIGAVYNLGGGRSCNTSVREAITLAEEITGNPMRIDYIEQHRAGDHIWYVTDLTKFRTDYPHWQLQYDNVRAIAEEIYEFGRTRWHGGGASWSTMANTTY